MPMPSNCFEPLADELILEILTYLWTNQLPSGSDKWSISQCNRRLRRIALPLLYQTVYIPSIKSLGRFLRNTIRNPANAILVKTLQVDWYCNDVFHLWSAHIKCMERARVYSPDQSFVWNIEEEDPKTNLAHLLHLLSELEILDIKAGPRYDRDIFPYLVNFLNKSHMSSKLQRFEWRRCDVGLLTLIPALLVPSMKVFRCIQVVTDEFFDPHWFPDLPDRKSLASWYGQSSIEELSLIWPDINGQEFEEVLRLPRALKILIYHGEHFPPPKDREAALMRALDHVSASLEFLYLFWQSTYGQCSILSFRKFNSLKFLVLNCSFVFDPPDSTPGLRTIAKSLPPALEIFFLYRYSNTWPKEYILDCWRRLLSEKSSTRLPNLRFVGQQAGIPLLAPLIDFARSRKVEVVLRISDFIRLKESFLSDIRRRNGF
ncbi:hypothetical protein CPB86DRAFT_65592 [Serendipita vermifera]|nr:hypothetical protein CPB86DRAFT_65592 [Serendipita vermifera]